MAECLECSGCRESLVGRKFLEVEQKPHCVSCYDRLFAHNCEECKQLIAHDAKELSFENRHYHRDCFRCSQCSRSLAEEPFSSLGQSLVCSDCFTTDFSSRCAACDKSLAPGSRMLEYDGSTWHEDCFCCQSCGKSIGSEAFVPDNQNCYCVSCYEARFAPHCHLCSKAVTKGGLTYRDRAWHSECFFCSSCKVPLSGQTFTSQDEQPYCVKCFSSLYAKKCTGCNTPITGFGDGKYVSFEERQWHQPCFKCSRCSVSLLGSGFFPDRDRILCKDCNSED